MASWPGVQPVIVPGRHVEEPYASLFAGKTSFAEYVAQAKSRVDPVFDDRPFFFARAKPWGLPGAMRRAFLADPRPRPRALRALPRLRQAEGRSGPGPYAASIVYFASLGVGFIAVELSLLQHLTLLLGHPIFTLSILLFTLLAAGGLGSRSSGRFRLGPVCLGVAALAALYALVLPRVVPAPPAPAARRADRDRHPARGPARLPDGHAVPPRARRRRAQGPFPRAALLLGAQRHLLASSGRWPRWWPRWSSASPGRCSAARPSTWPRRPPRGPSRGPEAALRPVRDGSL